MNQALIENALVNIESEGPEWLEWSAALYESYVADQEWNRGETYWEPAQHGYALADFGGALASLSAYGNAAQKATEQLERDVYARAYARRYGDQDTYKIDYSGQ